MRQKRYKLAIQQLPRAKLETKRRRKSQSPKRKKSPQLDYTEICSKWLSKSNRCRSDQKSPSSQADRLIIETSVQV